MRPSPSLARNPSSHDNTDLSPDDDKDHAERLRYSGIDNVADKIYRIRFELAKLKKRKQLARPEDDAGCVDGDRHDPWYGIPEPVGPSVEQERVSLAAKAAKRLESSAWSSDNGLQQKKKRQRSTK
ncbi:hypothetical protein BDZ45DRAFT_674324 [Acephala macrosclerotiorum]|nr:hypothetical protein BDZ45DRAFT_674324 [Acephala macrosclerotiorum]